MSTEESPGSAVQDSGSWTTAPAGPQVDAVSREAPVPPEGTPSVPEIIPDGAEVPEEAPQGDLAESADTPGDAVVEPPD